MKATSIAPANNALIKYWGRKDNEIRLPANNSISINLNGLTTTTTVEFSEDLDRDEITINSKPDHNGRVIKHLDRIRELAGINTKAKVVSQNNYPTAAGLSSSSSGFAALTVAACAAAGLKLTEKELTILSRKGSGSSCRSVPGGFVEWITADRDQDSYAHSIFPETHWEIYDLAVIVSTKTKKVSSSDGHKLAQTSAFFKERIKSISTKLELLRKTIEEKNFSEFGEIVEAEALNMHAIMITSNPALLYWSVGTLKLMQKVQEWREQGLECYFTINTGQNIHLLCQPKTKQKLLENINAEKYVQRVITNEITGGAKLVDEHLF